MIALKPFSKRMKGVMVKVLEGKEIPKSVLAFYSKNEIQEMKEKKIIGDSKKDEPVKKSNKENK